MKLFGFLCDLRLHGLLIEIRAPLAFLPNKTIEPLGLFSEAEKGNLVVGVSWALLVMRPPECSAVICLEEHFANLAESGKTKATVPNHMKAPPTSRTSSRHF